MQRRAHLLLAGALVACLLVAVPGPCAATTDPLEVVDGSTDSTQAELATQAAIDWVLVIHFAESVNKELELMTTEIAALYAGGDAAQISDDLLVPHCPLDDVTVYIANETRFYDFLCCHSRKARSPALAQLMIQLVEVFFGTPADVVGPLPEHAIADVRHLQENDAVAIRAGYCKDDTRLHGPGYLISRARFAAKLLGKFYQSYFFARLKATSLASCIGQPLVTTGCVTNAQTTLAQASANVLFALVDAQYQGVCGAPVLGAFEADRLDPFCPP